VVLNSAPDTVLRQLGARRYGKEFFVNSTCLNRFLRQTFVRETRLKCPYPLTQFVPDWIARRVDLRRILLLLLLTDGGGAQNRNLYFYSMTDLYHEILVDCVWSLTGEYPTSYKIPSTYVTKSGDLHVTPDTEYWRKAIIGEMFRLTPSLKTSPAVGQSVDDYSCESQPTAKFLLEGSRQEKELMTLLLVGTEGYVTPFCNRNGYCAVSIGFRCGHPTLLGQFTRILQDVGIHMVRISEPERWGGVGGVHNQSYDTALQILNLLERHGDLLGEIHGQSRYHEGQTKSAVLQAGLDVYLRQKQGVLERYLRTSELQHLITRGILTGNMLSGRALIDRLARIPRIHRNIRSLKRHTKSSEKERGAGASP
jgi:hypothetical protein